MVTKDYKIKWNSLKFWVKEIKRWGWGITLTNMFILIFMKIIHAKRVQITYEKTNKK